MRMASGAGHSPLPTRAVYRDVYELNAAVPERFRPIVRPVRGFGYRFALEEHRTASGF